MAYKKKNITEDATIKEDKTSVTDKIKEIYNDTEDTTKKYKKDDIASGKLFALLSYLGILSLIPFFLNKEGNTFVEFHAKQGVNLFIYELLLSVALGVVNGLLVVSIIGIPLIPIVSLIVGALIFILSIIGIINVLNGYAKELPLINKYPIIK